MTDRFYSIRRSVIAQSLHCIRYAGVLRPFVTRHVLHVYAYSLFELSTSSYYADSGLEERLSDSSLGLLISTIAVPRTIARRGIRKDNRINNCKYKQTIT